MFIRPYITLALISLSSFAFAQTPTLSWAKQNGGLSIDHPYEMATDSYGHIISTGAYAYDGDYDPGIDTILLNCEGTFDIYIQKLDIDGNLLWVKSFGNSGEDIAYSIQVDNDNNIYITGQFEHTIDFDPGVGVFNLTSNGGEDAFILKLNSDGDFLWATSFGGVGDDSGTDLNIDASGNIQLVGAFSNKVDFEPGPGITQLISEGSLDIFLLQLDANGALDWVRQIGGTSVEYVEAMIVDNNGYIYLTGSFEGITDFDPEITTHNLTATSYKDGYILKLNSDGHFEWVKPISGMGLIIGRSITVDENSNVYTTGIFQDTADFDPGIMSHNMISAGSHDAFVQKLTSNGNFDWAYSMGSPSFDLGNSIYTDINNDIFITGSFASTVDFDPDPINQLFMTSSGDEDVYIQKIDTNGNLLWVNSFGGPEKDQGYSITTDIYENIVSVGSFWSTADFDPGVDSFFMESAGTFDIYIQKLNHCGVQSVDAITSCEPITWIDGVTYSSSNNTANHHLLSSEGCDSLVYLDLSITDLSNINLSANGTLASINSNSGNYKWLDCNFNYNVIPNATSSTYNGEPGGSYAVEITENGCVDTTACITIANIGLTESMFKDLFKIYPNPNNGTFKIQLSEPIGQLYIRMTSILGQEFYKETHSNTNVINLHIDQPIGVYLIDISDGKGNKTTLKVLKK